MCPSRAGSPTQLKVGIGVAPYCCHAQLSDADMLHSQVAGTSAIVVATAAAACMQAVLYMLCICWHSLAKCIVLPWQMSPVAVLSEASMVYVPP